MNFLTLQPLTPSQLTAAVQLDQCCLGGLWTEAGYQREIDSPNSDLLALADSSQLIGLACTWAILDEAHVTLVAVDPRFRHQGLGQLLLYTLLVLARQRELEWATLEVRSSNQAAIKLYEKFGFESVGTRPKYYADGEDALILWCKGLQKPEFRQVLRAWQQQIGERLAQSNWQLAEFPSPVWRPIPAQLSQL